MSNSRRKFIKKTVTGSLGAAVGLSATNVAAKGLSAKSYSRIIGANDRIHVAIQGLGRRYGAFIPAIADKKSNVDLVYLCDVMQSRVTKAIAHCGKKGIANPKIEEDYRKILEDKDIDAVFLATPDHWHTPGACMGMQAGKHVYVEKPCSHNPHEGELLVEFQQKYDRVVQMGNQQRSSLESNDIIPKIHNGIIGKAYKGLAFYTNGRGRTPNPKKAPAPDGLNWELFQGPAPRKAYEDDTWNYNWHWYGWDYGTAEMGNNATHELDIARWALDVKYPKHVNVLAHKNQYVDDGWEMYDTMEATYNYDNNRQIQWDGRSRTNYDLYGAGRGTIIFGSEGSVFIDRGGYKHFGLDGKLITEKQAGSEGSGVGLGGHDDLSTLHVINFFDTIRGKATLNAPIDQGAISQHLTHYANISYRIGKPIEIDDVSGRIYDRDAMKLWSREYEPGWEPKL